MTGGAYRPWRRCRAARPRRGDGSRMSWRDGRGATGGRRPAEGTAPVNDGHSRAPRETSPQRRRSRRPGVRCWPLGRVPVLRDERVMRRPAASGAAHASGPAARCTGAGYAGGPHLLDPSATGAQIEHLDLFRLGAACALDLPPPGGALSLPAQVDPVYRDRAEAQARRRVTPRGPERPSVHHAHRRAARGPRRHPAAPRSHALTHR